MTKVRDWLKNSLGFLVFVVCFFAFRWSFADHYHVPSGSMEPTIHVGDRILVNKAAFQLKIPYTDIVLHERDEPKRGDIVVFDNPANGIRMVKRLIGLPGDELRLEDGFISINGEWVEGSEEGKRMLESGEAAEFVYRERLGDHDITVKRSPESSIPHVIEVRVPEGKYFVMGDNRDESADSRIWGFISKRNLSGRAFRIFFNLDFSENYVPSFKWERIAHPLI